MADKICDTIIGDLDGNRDEIRIIFGTKYSKLVRALEKAETTERAIREFETYILHCKFARIYAILRYLACEFQHKELMVGMKWVDSFIIKKKYDNLRAKHDRRCMYQHTLINVRSTRFGLYATTNLPLNYLVVSE